MSARRAKFDWVLEAVALAAFVAIIGTIAVSWNSLPPQVPIHFGASGEADRFGDKSGLLVIPLVATFLYGLLTAVSGNTRLVNIPLALDPDAPEVQALILRMVIVLKTVLLVNLFYITWAIVKIGGHSGGLGNLFLPISTAAVFLVLGYYIVQLRRHQK